MAGGGAQQGQSDNSAGLLWGVAALFAFLGAIWIFFKDYIIHGYLTVKLFEANMLKMVIGSHIVSARDTIITSLASSQKVDFEHLISLGGSVGVYLRYPIILILATLAVIVYFGNTTRVFKRNYGMKELAELEKDNWPQITPVVNLDLLKTDIDKGPWAMALKPIQFCKRNGLLDEVKTQEKSLSRRNTSRINVVLKKGEANKIFALQLGPLWKGIDKLPPYARALFAIFAARINADSKPAAELISRLAASCNTKLDFTGVDELIKKHGQTKIVQESIDSHAYVFTVMATMLERARDDGVQASADFLWLKPVDRRMWYTLNTVGRQTPFIEVAGIFAHWVAEKEAGRKLVVPTVEEATKAVEVALTEVIYNPEEV